MLAFNSAFGAAALQSQATPLAFHPDVHPSKKVEP
jgi:hypothetical protein